MNLILILSIVLLAISIVMLITHSGKKIVQINIKPMYISIGMLILSCFLLFFLYLNNKDKGHGFFEVSNDYKLRGINNYRNLNPGDKTVFSWGNLDTLQKLIKKFQDQYPQDTDYVILLNSITYDADQALRYVENNFRTYPYTKQEYIDYYRRIGYDFNNSSSNQELSTAIIDRNSMIITIENHTKKESINIDMGRLCPPNCPN